MPNAFIMDICYLTGKQQVFQCRLCVSCGLYLFDNFFKVKPKSYVDITNKIVCPESWHNQLCRLCTNDAKVPVTNSSTQTTAIIETSSPNLRYDSFYSFKVDAFKNIMLSSNFKFSFSLKTMHELGLFFSNAFAVK